MESKSTNPLTHALTPIWKLSPNHQGSNLLDYYELQAVTRQLNRAIQASNSKPYPHSCYLRSPFYLPRLDRIYKENAKISKKISGSKQSRREGQSTVDAKGARVGFMIQRLWKKVKQGLARGNTFNT